MVGIPVLIAVFAISFALGSLPSGVIVGKLFYGIDIREQGSGNIGTTNAIRAMGKKGGYTVFLMDFGKGLLAGFLARVLFAHFEAATGAVGLSACLAFSFLGCGMGHIFSPWLGFKGGKGIAVCVGCMFMTFGVIPALVELGLFIVLVVITKYVSLGSIAAAVLCVILSFVIFWGDPLAIAAGAVMGSIVVWAHRGNIKRLLDGTERRVGDKKKAA